MEFKGFITKRSTHVQIAERLIVSLHTVNAHVRSIFNKLEVSSRGAATRFAIQQGLLLPIQSEISSNML